ncbi:uncharacterized protein LOC142985191 isoform X8 [Anticarsia gemmatalis]|uniref:uncharacterized protein LOC142985191 isoform X8 n=1 Tax=Anticarsia gemmatalis TaxID=129554 RepID=UPI003F76581A
MDFEQIVVKEGPGLCRCCLTEGCYKDLGKEYTWMNETEVYADMLLECFDISITQHNEGPNGPNRLICEVCITRLRDACYFKKQVQDSEKKFIDMMGRGEFRSKNAGATDTVVIFQQQMKTEAASDVPANVVDAEVEFLDEEIGFADDAEDDDTIEDPEPSVSDITVSSLPIKGKRGRPKKTTAKTDKKAKIAKLDDKPKAVKSIGKGRKTRTEEESYLERLTKIRRNILLVLHYGKVTPFHWHTQGYKCFYCKKSMKDCDVLKEHTKKHIVDLKTFIPKRIISKDVPIKVDIEGIACKMCPNTPIDDLKELISHIMLVHEENFEFNAGECVFPFKLNNDLMKCVLCDNVYDNFTSMIWHMHRDHVDHSSVCQICGLSFINQIRLKRHINNTHIGYRCTICGKTFRISNHLEKHKQRFHGFSKFYHCNLCSAKFENSYQLKVHLGNVHNVEKYKIKCEHCPKVCTTKGAMVMHYQTQHSNLKYECDLCDYKAGIKWLVTLHKRKHYGVKDYCCSICERMFRRSSNLRVHMKVHSGVSGRVCRICRKGFTSFDALKSHELQDHVGED